MLTVRNKTHQVAKYKQLSMRSLILYIHRYVLGIPHGGVTPIAFARPAMVIGIYVFGYTANEGLF